MLSKAEIKKIKSLSSKKGRDKYQLFIIEGSRLVADAITFGSAIEQIYATEHFLTNTTNTDLINLITENALPVNIISDKELKSISDTITPSGVLSLCPIPEVGSPKLDNDDNWLYLDGISDPGNLGTLLRSAAWFGIKNVGLSSNCINPYNPKVVRGGMGAHFKISIFSNVSLNTYTKVKHTIIGAFQDGKDISKINDKSETPWVLVIGSEAHGVNPLNNNLIDMKITIPKIGSGDSLNAGVAGSILLYQLTKK